MKTGVFCGGICQDLFQRLGVASETVLCGRPVLQSQDGFYGDCRKTVMESIQIISVVIREG